MTDARKQSEQIEQLLEKIERTIKECRAILRGERL